MKAKLVPVFFKSAQEPNFASQLSELKTLLSEDAEILEPVALGGELPAADGVIFPEMLGAVHTAAWKKLKLFQQPIMVVTSEFGTVSMWDWEINSYLCAKA